MFHRSYIYKKGSILVPPTEEAMAMDQEIINIGRELTDKMIRSLSQLREESITGFAWDKQGSKYLKDAHIYLINGGVLNHQRSFSREEFSSEYEDIRFDFFHNDKEGLERMMRRIFDKIPTANNTATGFAYILIFNFLEVR